MQEDEEGIINKIQVLADKIAPGELGDFPLFGDIREEISRFR
jgi:hypothetical protein